MAQSEKPELVKKGWERSVHIVVQAGLDLGEHRTALEQDPVPKGGLRQRRKARRFGDRVEVEEVLGVRRKGRASGLAQDVAEPERLSGIPEMIQHGRAIAIEALGHGGVGRVIDDDQLRDPRHRYERKRLPGP